MTLSCDLSCDQDYVILMSKFEENLGGWGDFITVMAMSGVAKIGKLLRVGKVRL